MNYTPYHVHTMLSNGITNIDSVSTFQDYISLAKEYGIKSFGFSEHGSVLEWVQKKLSVEKAGMKYIHSEEFYITEDIKQDELVRDNYHCIIIAKNYEGVKELNKLSSKSFYRDGHFYYQPRISFDELLHTSDNLIITTACIGGILGSNNEQLKKRYIEFLKNNKNRCFLEIQHHVTEEQIKYNKYLLDIHKQTGIPLIAGTDSHAANEIDISGRTIMQRSKSVSFSGEDGWDLVFRSYDELIDKYRLQNALPEKYYIEALENTNLMADEVKNFDLDYSHKYPVLYEDSLEVFKQKISDGVKQRGLRNLPNFDEYKKRIGMEYKTYVHNGAVDFMLLEEDYKRALREQGVVYGYSRGSVSGSLIAYLLGITEVDSVKYNLNFSRFMNPERVSLADVDTDWYGTDRDKVRDYLFNKDGLYCCNIVTFNTIKLRGAIKDVGRALGMSPEQTQMISNFVVEDENKNEIIPDSIKEQYKELFHYVDIVKGTITSLGRHAAGLVVSPIDVEEAFGTLRISTDERPISQINMKEIDLQNYLKLDILGLDGVGLIKQACDLAGIDYLVPDKIDFNDKNVWDDLAKNTVLCFQFESDFAGSYLKEILKPETIENIRKVNPNFSYIDLMAMANGAIRPAGASYRNELSHGIYRDNGNKELNEFLSPTLGFLVYQEQIIEFLHRFCGFTMGEADIVRRHFSKKTGTENDIPIIKDGGYMTENHYIKGFIQTMEDDYGIEKEESERIIEQFLTVIIDASDYLFSYNHALPYAFIGYAIAWLKHYYPLETYTAALNIYETDTEKMNQITALVKELGIEIVPIKFGKSKAGYMMDKKFNKIYKGIKSIKKLNGIIAEELYELANNKKHDNFIELLKDVKENTSVQSDQLDILIGLNFFSDYGKNQYLLDIVKIYNNFADAKIIKKDSLESLGIDEYTIKKYSCKETKKQYRDIDNNGLILELCKKVDDKSFGLLKQMQFEEEYLKYIDYKNGSVDREFYVITEFKQYKDVNKPYFVARRICDGIEIKARIKDGKIYRQKPFGRWSVLRIWDFRKDFKKKPNALGVWEVTDELEDILDEYEIIKD